MQVLHLVDSTGLYGAEKLVLALMEGQRQLGVQAVLGSLGGRRGVARPIEEAARRIGIPTQKFPMKRGLNLAGGKRVVDFAVHNRFDVLHSHGYKGNLIVGLLPRWLRRIPLLITLHGWRPPMSSTMRLIQWMEVRGIMRAEHVTVVDDSLATDQRLAGLPLERLSVIHNGVSAPSLAVDSVLVRRISEFVNGRFSIAGIGRLSEEKGFHLLLRAAAELRGRGVDCVVCLFGDGTERGRLEQMVGKLGLAGSVLLLGYVESASSYLSPFDCLAMPSLTEGLPLVAIEAMHMRKPIIAANVGGLPTLLEHGRFGRLFQSGDILALSAAIEDACEDDCATRRLAELAYDVVQSKHGPGQMAKDYVEIYSKL